MTIHWSKLIIIDADGDQWPDNLGKLVEAAPTNLNSATISEGRITEWPQFFLSAPGEEAGWDTPLCEVDWTGFEDALQTARR